MTAPSASDLRRAICCPRGACMDPRNCYADDRSRAYPVHIHEAAEAVAQLLQDAWATADVAAGRTTWEAEDAQREEVWR